MKSQRTWLGPPAATSPSGLVAKRKQLLRPDRLRKLGGSYDLVVIGSGLAGLTAAQRLGRLGYRVLVLEQHYNFGGLATWFKRPGGHVFDVSLHGFPAGMIKTCRKYWSREIADAIVRIDGIRFENPQFRLQTSFDKDDFTRILTERFDVGPAAISGFFDETRSMNHTDQTGTKTRDLFEHFFPGRTDIHRLLMEPIAYANGSTLDDPALTYGIVFSNFMSKGVYTFRGGTDWLIQKMKEELRRNEVTLQNYAQVERVLVDHKKGRNVVEGVRANGIDIRCRAVVSNANIWTTVFRLAEQEAFDPEFLMRASEVRMNSSSSQVYIGFEKGFQLPRLGDLFFTSSAPEFDSRALTALDVTSRTFSFYHPELRPGHDRCAVVASINSNYEDWEKMDFETYTRTKELYAGEAIAVLRQYIPGVETGIEHVEVATPKTFEFFTQHHQATSFGTKFEGLSVSQDLPKQVGGLFHAGSVGIIMSGWLGAANYGVIVANEVDRYLGDPLPTTEDKSCSSTFANAG
ncbi:MAG: phytoene desaturase family protein [Myxococcota bacterium]